MGGIVQQEAARFGYPSPGDAFTQAHLVEVQRDPNAATVTFSDLKGLGFIFEGGTLEVTLTHAQDGTRTTVSVAPNCTILEVRRAAMLATGQTRLSELKIVRRTNDGGYEPLPDTEPLNARQQLETIGCSLE